MSAPFQSGDVVVCVDDRSRDPRYADHAAHLRRRQTYRVERIDSRGGVVLRGLPLNQHGFGYLADRFRKIDDEQIPEVLERLKALGKQRERHDA